MATLMAGPLVGAGARPGQGRPARLAPIESAMGSLESLAHLATDDAMLTSLTTAWETLRETYRETRHETGRDTSSSAVSSSVTSSPVSVEILGEPSDDDLAFGVDALYVMLAVDDAAAPAQAALASIHAVLGNDSQARAFANLWQKGVRPMTGWTRQCACSSSPMIPPPAETSRHSWHRFGAWKCRPIPWPK